MFSLGLLLTLGRLVWASKKLIAIRTRLHLHVQLDYLHFILTQALALQPAHALLQFHFTLSMDITPSPLII